MNQKPELLAPAGDLEKLFVAVHYGADAVYVGGENYSLRAKAKNFDSKKMEEGIRFAHSHDVRVYVAANIFAHNDDFIHMKEYFKQVYELGADALIVSDPGVFLTARECVPQIELHISTQANNTNYKSALFWKKLGAKRIVLARELSFKEIAEITQSTAMDFEAFVHGAMCISYSGRCLLSNYLNGRDSNKGECSHPCRYKYYVVEETRPGQFMPVEEDQRGTYIYNAKDLCMINHIDKLIDAGIKSFKIEGRMKTSFYVGSVVKAYREAIDDYIRDKDMYFSKQNEYLSMVSMASHRDYSTGFYFEKPYTDSQIYGTSSYTRNYNFTGMVLDYTDGIATISQRNKFVLGDDVLFLRAKKTIVKHKILDMVNEDGETLTEAPHPFQIVKMKVSEKLRPFDMMIVKTSERNL